MVLAYFIMDRNYINRRRLLQFGSSYLGLSLFPKFSLAAKSQPDTKIASRVLRIKALNTNEFIESAYFINGHYVAKELDRLNQLFRDYRTGKHISIDPKLFDQLYAINQAHGLKHQLLLICGYRSPETNNKLRSSKKGVAEKSLHMEGRAADFRLEGVPLNSVLKTALQMKFGGVGYYPRSNFIHIDTGINRFWPRAEIAKAIVKTKSV